MTTKAQPQVDLYTSPCRRCTKVMEVNCRARCKRLAAYRKQAITHVPTISYNEQYAAIIETFGMPRTPVNPLTEAGPTKRG